MITQQSPFPLEKKNVLYTLCGRRSGSKANMALQKMVASATLSTPSVAASGATTVWGNGPTAPPNTFTHGITFKSALSDGLDYNFVLERPPPYESKSNHYC
jgi:hypothetical protein